MLVDSRVQLAGDIDALLATHHRLTGPRRDGPLPGDQHVVSASHTDRQSTLLVRTDAPILDPAWTVASSAWRTSCSPTWAGPAERAAARAGGGPMIWLTWRQFRAQARVVAGAVAALLAVPRARPPAAADVRRPPSCERVRSPSGCAAIVYIVGIAVVLCAPAIVGMFWGAPLVARELEAGTHRLAWNQIGHPHALAGDQARA